MICTTNDLSAWKDFPKGLKVLLLDEDSNSAAELKSKLEAMDYIVYTFCNENEALSAVSSRPESFHVAIVEINTNKKNGSFKFLETAKDLPTIMTSNIHCISTVMKCIALGAVEFLKKPLSEEKLRNIWQHVVRKAFNAVGTDLSESVKPVEESLVSMLYLQLENGEPKDKDLDKTQDASVIHENDPEPSTGSDKYPAPSTPQIEQGGRLSANGDCQDHANCSIEKESSEQDGESKSVETTSDNTIAEVTIPVGQPQGPRDTMVTEEADLVDGTKGKSTTYSQTENGVNSKNSQAVAEKPSTVSGIHSSCLNKANRKKSKVDWTPALHKKFVQAVDQLGIDQAIPSRILELMKIEGLTRHNVASHLQVHADAWGCPVMPPPHGYSSAFTQVSSYQNASVFHCSGTMDNRSGMPPNSVEHQPAEEVIDKVVKEAINKPWLPLPLGLKPPSTDTVLAELSKQGISTFPPHIYGLNSSCHGTT
ncbi:hypothetical protein ERO13_D12G213200v2 [Gossypium hirsutum]|uniref:Two-component response regulator-like APRR2 isoform X5 n=1 Tax=Gossypium hirsutum TaxID=3635 RepID=A0A1U8NC98_GOSHI|nr:two-component response regulator-like APRR2 isoform X5 [Gossypium hirsutum]KAG4117187.1 hypothetical protein ERO13_D12G213200v2 [Gossypium hirsutum]